MKSKNILSLVILISVLLGFGSCGGGSGDDGPGPVTDNFDRAAMLANWADNIIIPRYDNYMVFMDALKSNTESFVADASMTKLAALRTAWENAYKSWQYVSMFEIGMAETLTIRNFTNIFPTDTDEVDGFIANGGYNLELPSTNDAQGFPALDYLLFGLAADDAGILAALSTDNHKTYLTDLVNRLWTLGDAVRRDWRTAGYRDTFVNSNGSSATSSVNKLTNDFMFYYEKSLRAGKVGIPAGVFSGSPLSNTTEAQYQGELSKELLLIAISASQDFFRGISFDNNQTQGESLQSYLQALNVQKDETQLYNLINTQFTSANSAAQMLMDDLKAQVEADNSKMLQTYDELQKLVVLLKVDMFQALNIQVDFVDADGD